MSILTRHVSELHPLTDEELTEILVAELNLACAVGLPGAENLDIDGLLAKLAHWADEVFHQTRSNWHRFLANPAEYENSPAYFRMLVLITVLQRDLGVRYNPARVNDLNFQDPYSINPDFSDSRDLFLHGILAGPGGTCASMPVLYVAVGRLIGYPLVLVEGGVALLECPLSHPKPCHCLAALGQAVRMVPRHCFCEDFEAVALDEWEGVRRLTQKTRRADAAPLALGAWGVMIAVAPAHTDYGTAHESTRFPSGAVK